MTNPVGRPPLNDYDPEIAKQICSKLIVGKSLVTACREIGCDYNRVFIWLAEYPEFLGNYTRAREAQADYLADGVLDVADDLTIDPNHKRIMVDSRKWVAGKMKPKKYGDRQIVSGDADNPIKTDTTIEIIHVKP